MLSYNLSLWRDTPGKTEPGQRRKRGAKIRGLNALRCLKGILALKRTLRGLDFDYRASFCKVLDRGDGLGQSLAD